MKGKPDVAHALGPCDRRDREVSSRLSTRSAATVTAGLQLHKGISETAVYETTTERSGMDRFGVPIPVSRRVSHKR